MYEGDWKKKKMFMGFVILVFGLIWYMRDTGQLTLEPFWPIMAILAGVLLIVKAIVMSPMSKKRR